MLEQISGHQLPFPLPSERPAHDAAPGAIHVLPVGLPATVLHELQTVLVELGRCCLSSRHGEPADGGVITLMMVQGALHCRGSDPSDVDGPAIAIVGRDLPDVERLLEQGFIDYITYPFSPLEIRRRLLGLFPSGQETAVNPTLSFSDRLIRAACSAMEERLDLTPCVERLALKAGTNRTTLNRVFNQRFGMGPITWLRHRRCEEAARLLVAGADSILSIALSVGYTDANNFSTAFRRVHGVSPKEFRRKLQLAKISGTAAKAARHVHR